MELIVAIAILGVCVVAIGAGIALSVKISTIHREQATAQDSLHNFAETIAPRYTGCAGSTAPNYVNIASLSSPSGFNAPTASVKFWDPTTLSFSSSTCPGSDPGLQQVSLQLTTTDGFVSESLLVTVRSG